MQLRNARLCLDCDEVHQDQRCPICASESFGFIKRWVPSSEHRGAPQPPDMDGAHRETVATYKELLAASQESRLNGWRFVKGGAVSLALLGAAGWVWRRNSHATSREAASSDGDAAHG
jgi:hypothetical protein